MMFRPFQKLHLSPDLLSTVVRTDRPTNGQENAGIDDRRLRGSGWVVVGSTRVRIDPALGGSVVNKNGRPAPFSLRGPPFNLNA
jgi:hypothetical protein